ncbi:hypothetical protein GN958_ATG11123 [Phytophthora infestans]|uniref:Uncharacterized protein n=1 Tax=Phytophthora infestans TaxID=4787 RepID=A0A8S9UMP4_PHYIN|nr:hypothetical protein GN958_ATG11123 [Phytophthora infestans]
MDSLTLSRSHDPEELRTPRIEPTSDGFLRGRVPAWVRTLELRENQTLIHGFLRGYELWSYARIRL